jgi:hypothetical protein
VGWGLIVIATSAFGVLYPMQTSRAEIHSIKFVGGYHAHVTTCGFAFESNHLERAFIKTQIRLRLFLESWVEAFLISSTSNSFSIDFNSDFFLGHSAYTRFSNKLGHFSDCYS